MQWKTKLNKIKNIKKNSKIKRITEKKAVRETASFAGAIGKKSIAANSASIAFYVFISMIPLFILLCSQLPMTGIGKAELTSALTDMMPATIRELVSSIISEAYNSRIGVFSFSIVMLLWSSSRGVLALIRSLDIVYDERDRRNIINMYMFSIFYTVCLVFAVTLMLVLYTKELSAEELIRSMMPSSKIYDSFAKYTKDFDVILIGTLICAFIYKIAPAGKRKFMHQMPGAVFSSLAITVFSIYFAAYTSGSNIYKSFYGSLTTICLFLIWMYSCINIFLIGGLINSHYRKKISRFYTAIDTRLKSRHTMRLETHEQKRRLKKGAAEAAEIKEKATAKK